MDTIYTSDGRIFEGMTEDVVKSLMSDMDVPCTFITKEEFETVSLAKVELAPVLEMIEPLPTTEEKLNNLIATLKDKGII